MFDWSSPFNDRFLKMLLLRFYPGATPGKKRKQVENDDEKQKKKQEYEKNSPDRKLSSKWQTQRPWLGFYSVRQVTCILDFGYVRPVQQFQIFLKYLII